MTRRRPLRFGFLLLLLVGGTACSQDEETPTTPTTQGPTSFTQVFSGTLQPRTSQTYAFSLGSSLPVRLSLGSLTDANENPLASTLTMTFGRPAGTGCGALHTTTVQAGLATHMLFQPAPGTYCVAITDTGQLPAAALFGVRITQGEPSSTASPGTDTYTSVLFPGGFTSRTFQASAGGTVTVIMDTISPASVASLNVGVGFPRVDGGGCQLTQSFVAPRGGQLSVPVEIGTYCVKVSDPGTLTELTSFSLRIVHP
jgi:hypothetical protein